MKPLTPKEEEIMQTIWGLGRAFVKEVRKALPSPRPHINTVSTIMRKLVDKGYLDYENFGSTYRYFPVVTKNEYSKKYLQEKMLNYFDNSYKDLVAFFAKEEKISIEDLKDIIRQIESGSSK